MSRPHPVHQSKRDKLLIITKYCSFWKNFYSLQSPKKKLSIENNLPFLTSEYESKFMREIIFSLDEK